MVSLPLLSSSTSTAACTSKLFFPGSSTIVPACAAPSTARKNSRSRKSLVVIRGIVSAFFGGWSFIFFARARI
jgi:hypothetical protein